MQKDIKNLLKEYQPKNVEISKNHANKFEELLQKELHQQKPKKKNYKWLSVAASIILIFSLAIKFYPTKNIDTPIIKDSLKNIEQKEISLGSISPEFQTIEDYYRKSINLEISQLELTNDNKEIVNGYLVKITELTNEYKLLTQELNIKGVNDATIDALINNLQLRLQLLKRLQKQLKQLKNLNTTQNETHVL